MLPTTRLSYSLVADSMGLASLNWMQLALKAAVLSEIARNDGHWAIQGHSRSLILVLIENLFATYLLMSYRTLFPSYCGVLVKFSLLRVDASI